MNITRKKTIALILSMCIVLSCIPFTTFAIDSKTYSGENIIDNNREQEATIVTEITEKREADKKVYLLIHLCSPRFPLFHRATEIYIRWDQCPLRPVRFLFQNANAFLYFVRGFYLF